MPIIADELANKVTYYQSRCWADSTRKTRQSQWTKYFNFCRWLKLEPLPATLDMVLLYIAFLAETLAYSSILNYLSALRVLHRIHGHDMVDNSHFLIKTTLLGVKRVKGHCPHRAPPVTLEHLNIIFQELNLETSEGIAFWLVLLLGFRSLLRKSNLIEQEHSLKEKDVIQYDWGILLKIHQSKTIQFGERVVEIPLARLHKPGPMCIHHYVNLFRLARGAIQPDSQFLTYMVPGGLWRRASYSWFSLKLNGICARLGLPRLTSHSLRRGGATALAAAGVPIQDIQQRGDWKSMQVLTYLDRSRASKLRLDRHITANW